MSEWKTLTLSDVSDIRISNVDKTSIAGDRAVLLCNYMDVYGNEYITRGLDFMEATANDVEIEKFKVENGDVLITKDSESPYDIGIPSVVIDHIEGLVCAYHLALIKPALGIVDSIFLGKQLAHSETARYFSRIAAGSTRYGLSNKAIANTVVRLPSFKSQKRIARILQTIDQAIEKTKALIVKYQQIKAGLMHDLFTRGIGADGQLRPPREQAPELYQETPIGWIPKEWSCAPLSAVADLFVGYAFKSTWFQDDGVRLLRGENVGYGRPDWSDKKCLSHEKALQFQEYFLEAGDVVIGMDRSFTKSGVKITVLTSDDCPSLLVQRVGKFIATGCQHKFLRWILMSSIYLHALMNHQKGMDIPHLSKSEILEPQIPLPGQREQITVANKIESCDLKISMESAVLEKLQEQRSGLMHDLLTGKVPVQVEPEAEPEAALV